MWTMEELLQVAREIDGGKPRMGIKKEPWWPFIPLSHFVVPLLHVLIGIGNDLLDGFRDWVNDEVESLDHQEVRTRRAVQRAEHRIIDTIAERADWDDTPDGVLLKQLKGKMRYRRGLLRKHGARMQFAATQAAEEQHQAIEDVGVEQLLSDFGTLVGEDYGDGEDDGAEGTADVGLDGEDNTEERIDAVIVGVEMPVDSAPALVTRLTAAYDEYRNFQSQSEPLAVARKEITDKLKRLKSYLTQMKKS